MTGVTVVTPAFNAEATIKDCILSVYRQTKLVAEHIIIDDGSVDCTVDLVKQLQAYIPRIKLIQGAHSGPALARNIGIHEARSRYIAFLDSDDLWYPNKLSTQLDFMGRSGAALCFTAYDIFDVNPEKPLRVRRARSKASYKDLLNRNHIGCLTAIYDTAQVGKIYMPEIRMRQDWGLWLRITKASGKPALGIDQPLAKLRLRAGSLSRNKVLAAWYNYRLLREVEGLSSVNAANRVLRGGVHAIMSE